MSEETKNENQEMTISDNSNQQLSAFTNLSTFVDAQRMAQALVSSSIVPQQFQGTENIGNAIVALEMAQRIGASPLMVMQNIYMVHGNPSWSSQFVIAALNGCGRYEPLEFNMFGDEKNDTWGCYVSTTVVRTGKTITGPKVTIDMAKAEGWYQKKGSKWKTMPELMLGYRAASFFGRRYAPDILMGMKSMEEVYDIIDMDQDTGEVVQITKGRKSNANKPDLASKLDATRQQIENRRRNGIVDAGSQESTTDAQSHHIDAKTPQNANPDASREANDTSNGRDNTQPHDEMNENHHQDAGIDDGAQQSHQAAQSHQPNAETRDIANGDVSQQDESAPTIKELEENILGANTFDELNKCLEMIDLFPRRDTRERLKTMVTLRHDKIKKS